jgi:hypothetical protein
MGRYSQKFRDLLNAVPKPEDKQGFNPELASMALAQTINKALQVIQEQEETILDLEEEVTKLQSQLILQAPEGGLEQALNSAKTKEDLVKDEATDMLEGILKKFGKDKGNDV